MKVFKLASLYLKHVFSSSQDREPFDLEKLREIDAEAASEKEAFELIHTYLGRTLPQVGTGRGEGLGSTRKVYELGADKVIKAAYLKWGAGQNSLEGKISATGNPLVTHVYDSHPNAYWIISERADGINGYSSFDIFKKATGLVPATLLEFCEGSTKDIFAFLYKTKGVTDKAKAANFLTEFVKLKNFGLSCADLCYITHWGITKSGKLKIYDYGGRSDWVKKLNQENSDPAKEFLIQHVAPEHLAKLPELARQEKIQEETIFKGILGDKTAPAIPGKIKR